MLSIFSTCAKRGSLAAVFLCRIAIAADAPLYAPQKVAPPRRAAYWDHGAITIVGYNDMEGMFQKLNALFTQYHPDFRFNMRLNGTAARLPRGDWREKSIHKIR